MNSGMKWLMERFESFGTAEAILGENVRYTYADFISAIKNQAVFFERHGIRSGDLVILETQDYSPEAITALWALWSLGAVVVPMTESQPMRRETCMGILKNGWICRTENDRQATDPDSHSISISSFTDSTDSDTCNNYGLIDKLRLSGHPGLILTTSGTTADPKAALHDVTKLLEKYRKQRKPAKTLGFLMFDHMGGIDTLAYALTSGGTLVLLPGLKRDPENVARHIERFGVELLPTSPTFLNHLLMSDCVDQFDFSSLRRISYGTEPMPAFTLARLQQKLPRVTLSQSYGTTELGVPGVRTNPESPAWISIRGDGVEIRIGNGELFVRSSGAMLGYLNAPCPFDSEGWYATGDLVEFDPSGNYYRILGRKSDVINVGGEKVAPAEVEHVILQASNVMDVLVTSQPNPLIGSMIVARVVLYEPEDPKALTLRLRAFCRDRLASYQVPVSFQIVTGLTRTTRGKLTRPH